MDALTVPLGGALKEGVRKAKKAARSGAALARGLGITRAAVNEWDRVPADRVVEVENLTGVPREELRPDLYRKAEDVRE